MNLSPEKLLEEKGLEEIHLKKSVFILGGTEKRFELEQQWSGLLFLKAVGFEKILIKNPGLESLRRWAERVEGYQQKFIHDPEYLQMEETLWNEADSSSSDSNWVIECLKPAEEDWSQVKTYIPSKRLDVPPLEGPLGISEQAREAFVREAAQQSTNDTLLRIRHILKEFRQMKADVAPELWVNLVGSVIAVALEERLIDQAVELLNEYRQTLPEIFKNRDITLRLISAYDPKGSELKKWNQIFSELPLQDLIETLETGLSSSAGPQLIRLMNLRAQEESEQFVELCFSSPGPRQKFLLQWLSPYWRPKHYGKILLALENSLVTDDAQLSQLWVQALLRSYGGQALKDLRKFFQPPTFWKKISGFFKPQENSLQRPILSSLADNPSSETLVFLKDIRPHVQRDVADEVEKLIRNYSGGRTS